MNEEYEYYYQQVFYGKYKLEGQYKCNVTLRRVSESLLPLKSSKYYYWSVCASAHV
jgi:hypothetical protein